MHPFPSPSGCHQRGMLCLLCPQGQGQGQTQFLQHRFPRPWTRCQQGRRSPPTLDHGLLFLPSNAVVSAGDFRHCAATVSSSWRGDSSLLNPKPLGLDGRRGRGRGIPPGRGAGGGNGQCAGRSPLEHDMSLGLSAECVQAGLPLQLRHTWRLLYSSRWARVAAWRPGILWMWVVEVKAEAAGECVARLLEAEAPAASGPKVALNPKQSEVAKVALNPKPRQSEGPKGAACSSSLAAAGRRCRRSEAGRSSGGGSTIATHLEDACRQRESFAYRRRALPAETAVTLEGSGRRPSRLR